jgi:hypothetical protein
MPVTGSMFTGAAGWAGCGHPVAGGALMAAVGGGAEA